MKKCILTVIVIITISACKKERTPVALPETKPETTALGDSINLDGYYSAKNIEEKVKWLKDSGRFVYDSVLKKAVLEDHEVKGIISEQKEKYTITWGKLKSKIGSYGYDAYLNVAYTDKKIDSLHMVKEYLSNEGESYYRFSTALIKNLAKRYAKDENAEFKFSFALLDEKRTGSFQPVVVIQVNGSPYYDYSTDPKAVPTDNLPL